MARKFRNELIVVAQGCWLERGRARQAPAFKVIFSTIEGNRYVIETERFYNFAVGFWMRPKPSFCFQSLPSLFPPSLSFALYWRNPCGVSEFFSLMDLESCFLTERSKACADRVRSLLSVC